MRRVLFEGQKPIFIAEIKISLPSGAPDVQPVGGDRRVELGEGRQGGHQGHRVAGRGPQAARGGAREGLPHRHLPRGLNLSRPCAKRASFRRHIGLST